MTAKTDLPTVPPALQGVALIDAPTCAAAGGMSVSWWHDAVRAGDAPKPVVRQPRCTRWRLADVVAFWQSFASKGDTQAAERLSAQAKRASAAARVKRKAHAQGAAA